MKRRGLFLGLGLGLLALLAACGGDEATPTPTATSPAPTATATSPVPTATATAVSDAVTGAVQLTAANFQYSPQTLEVQAGKPAQLEIASTGAGHTFTIRDLGVDVLLPSGTTQTVEFIVPEETTGELQWVCRFHESTGMGGRITVQQAADASDMGY